MTKRARIQRIIGLKERLRDVKRGHLAEIQGRHDAALLALRQADDQVGQLSNELCNFGEFSALDLQNCARMLAVARQGQQRARVHFHEVEQERETRRHALVQAGREVVSLELLDGRLGEDERVQQKRREQSMADEVAGRLAAVG